jgi:hypothetical protein
MVAALEAVSDEAGIGHVGELALKQTGYQVKGAPDVLNEADIFPVLARGAQLRTLPGNHALSPEATRAYVGCLPRTRR